ncbi:Zinc-finger homeodomain protein 4 [Sesamum alatum]|uniref:Zinc-finger homeodomain protein 4 n=1 Tax=Sesamum alatum TaxID=300844 RepID=A0AAE2CCU2_9LAMI|nr:Zinc-finger homeodomain protein 4 [Sesamum alatum]
MSNSPSISHDQEPKPLPSLDHHTNTAGEDDHAVLGGAPAMITSMMNTPTTAQLVDHHHQKKMMMMMNINKKSSSSGHAVKYMECLKNHAAAIGGNATDGCGEFMAGGEEGTLEALKCSACNCHRNFHRKIHIHHHHHHQPSSSIIINSPPPPPHDHHAVVLKKKKKNSTTTSIDHHHHQILTSSSAGLKPVGEGVSSEVGKKRFRTKFSQEQKEKMLEFAEKCGWKLQKVDDSEVRGFCQEIGIKRKVLKVWMHNNKYHLANKTKTTTITNN